MISFKMDQHKLLEKIEKENFNISENEINM